MQYFQSLQILNLLNFIIIAIQIIIGCDKKKPSKSAESSKKNPPDPSNPTPPPPSSHMYVDTTCQPRSVAITKSRTKPISTATSKMKTRSMNPYVKTKSVEPPETKKEPPKDMAKEMEKLREEASKDGVAKKEEEDFGYENCGDMTEDQLKKVKAKEAQKRKTTKQPPQPGKAPIVYKKATKYHVKK